MSPTGTAPRRAPTSPDFIVLVDDGHGHGHGHDDLLHLVVEIKGYRREDAKEKKATMNTYWVRASTAPAPTAAGPSQNSPTCIRYKTILRPRPGRGDKSGPTRLSSGMVLMNGDDNLTYTKSIVRRRIRVQSSCVRRIVERKHQRTGDSTGWRSSEHH